jgi:ketosteroid isomerase-like protein
VANCDEHRIDRMTEQTDVIAELEQRIAQAWVNRDRAALEAILAPEWSVTDPTGHVLTRQQVLQQTFESTDRRIDTMTVDDVEVRMYGDTAVATGRTQATGNYRGTAAVVVLRFTDVVVRRDGVWQVVASHGSFVSP